MHDKNEIDGDGSRAQNALTIARAELDEAHRLLQHAHGRGDEPSASIRLSQADQCIERAEQTLSHATASPAGVLRVRARIAIHQFASRALGLGCEGATAAPAKLAWVEHTRDSLRILEERVLARACIL